MQLNNWGTDGVTECVFIYINSHPAFIKEISHVILLANDLNSFCSQLLLFLYRTVLFTLFLLFKKLPKKLACTLSQKVRLPHAVKNCKLWYFFVDTLCNNYPLLWRFMWFVTLKSVILQDLVVLIFTLLTFKILQTMTFLQLFMYSQLYLGVTRLNLKK